VVVAAAAPVGFGFHALFGPGRPFPLVRPLPDHDLVLFSPGVGTGELLDESVRLFRTWEQTVDYLRTRHGDSARAAVFPSATTQLVLGHLAA
jgi:hypothetical protein